MNPQQSPSDTDTPHDEQFHEADVSHTAPQEPTQDAPPTTPAHESSASIPPITTPVVESQPSLASLAQPSLATPATVSPTPGIIVLQWLTYAFWGWTLIALSILIFIVLFNLISHTSSGNTSLYTLAAIVVLLPISLICDFIYQKHELKKKQGVSMAVMVIHAVIFALFAIGTLIGSLFSVVQLLLNSDGANSASNNVAMCLSLLIVAVLYSLTFFRTLNPLKNDFKVARIFDITMLVVIGVFTILAFVGPFAQSWRTKNDRLIESNLTYIENGIDSYARTNNKLPDKLEDVTLTNDQAKQLIDKSLVTYKQDAPDVASSDFRYQLCATYTLKDTKQSYDYRQNNEYSTYVTTIGHPAGTVCYKLYTPNYQATTHPSIMLR